MRTLALSLFSCWTLFSLTGCLAQQQLADQRGIIADQIQETNRLRAENDELRAEMEILRDSLQFFDDIDSGKYYRELRSLHDRIERLEYDLLVARDGGTTAATLLVDELFEPASATLTAAGMEALAALSAKLKESYTEHRFRIEAHSDSVPVGGTLKEKYPSNWELSAARSAAVVRYLIQEQEMKPERFEVVSFSAARPAASNETASGRRLNRRIRIAALPE